MHARCSERHTLTAASLLHVLKLVSWSPTAVIWPTATFGLLLLALLCCAGVDAAILDTCLCCCCRNLTACLPGVVIWQ
jgi:hypothetical protein